MKKRKYYISHDGSIDDFIGILALLLMEDVELLGMGVINADCYTEAAISVSRKMIDRFCPYSMEVSESTARPVNQFTEAWRRFAYMLDALPILNERGRIDAPLVEEPAHLHLIRKVRESGEKINIYAVGPLTDIATALDTDPGMEDGIESMIWMGGSFTGNGNINEPNHDGSAEWNAFWDPLAVERVLQSKIPITMVPLHATNQCRWHKSMGDIWARMRNYVALDFVGQCYSIISQLYEYFFWDTLTAAFIGNTSISTTRELYCSAVTRGISAGRIDEVQEGQGGRKVRILDKVDKEAVFTYLTELFKSAGTYSKHGN